jgi:DNA integrity scanning protein DisA with diadenylate cyclase activity
MACGTPTTVASSRSTPFTTAYRLADFVRTENQLGQLGGFQQARAVEVFLKYLKNQYTHLKAAYPEFAAERTGAAFVVNQIESAHRYFRNPAECQTQLNMLDE